MSDCGAVEAAAADAAEHSMRETVQSNDLEVADPINAGLSVRNGTALERAELAAKLLRDAKTIGDPSKSHSWLLIAASQLNSAAESVNDALEDVWSGNVTKATQENLADLEDQLG